MESIDLLVHRMYCRIGVKFFVFTFVCHKFSIASFFFKAYHCLHNVSVCSMSRCQLTQSITLKPPCIAFAECIAHLCVLRLSYSANNTRANMDPHRFSVSASATMCRDELLCPQAVIVQIPKTLANPPHTNCDDAHRRANSSSGFHRFGARKHVLTFEITFRQALPMLLGFCVLRPRTRHTVNCGIRACGNLNGP